MATTRLIFGPMFSEKTTELVRVARRSALAELNVLMIKYVKDVRYSEDQETIHSHDPQTKVRSADSRYVTVLSADRDSLFEVVSNHVETSTPSLVLIDEGQFFQHLLLTVVYLQEKGIDCVISALDSDYQRNMFKSIVEVIPFCSSITKVRGVCMSCKKADSIFTRRVVASNDLELIGGAESYQSVCAKCYARNLS